MSLNTTLICVFVFSQDPPGGFSSQEKTVCLKKEPRLSLGITIAGGRDCRNRLPVYITSVQPVGCLHRDGTIKRGTKQHLVICDFTSEFVFPGVNAGRKHYELYCKYDNC